jgi:protein-L-isoaspartate(D-aspartate) O-methyltransferase
MFGRRTQSMEEPPTGGGASGRDPYAIAREEMIEKQLRRRGVVMHSVLEAMRAIPRHLFVHHEYADRSYADEALPSQEGQTISQPYMVAVMTQELDIQRRGEIAPAGTPSNAAPAIEPLRVLELGTGTGYQTAILAWLVRPGGQVFTIERMPGLAESAQRRLAAMDIRNVHFLVGDGSSGWPRNPWAGPRSPSGDPLFNRIMVTAGVPEIPTPLLTQLADGGIMVVPVGSSDSQMLLRVEKHGNDIRQTQVLACRFVPLLGQHAWDIESYQRRQAEQTQ